MFPRARLILSEPETIPSLHQAIVKGEPSSRILYLLMSGEDPLEIFELPDVVMPLDMVAPQNAIDYAIHYDRLDILPSFLLSVPCENLSDEGESNVNLYYVRALLTTAENAGVILKRLSLLNAYFGIDAIKYTGDADDKTLLHEAAQYLAPKHLAILGFLIGYGIDPNYRDNDEMRAIDYAKQRGDDATSFIHYLRAVTPRMDNEYYQPVLYSSLNIS